MQEAEDIHQGVPASVYEAVKADMLKWKGRYRDVNARLTELTKERDDLSSQVKSLATHPDEKDARIAELAANLRHRDHKDAMAGMLKDLNLRGDALDALLTLSRYDPEQHQTADGQPDAELIKTFLGTAAKAHPWAVAATDVARNAILTNGKSAGPGNARGGAPTHVPSDPRVAATEGLRAKVGHADPFKIA